MIDANTKLVCIIGNPVEHSLSPQMHNAAFNNLGLNYVFTAIKVNEVKKAIEAFRTLNFAAFVVTVPHKKEVLKYVDDMDLNVRKIGAANLIVNRNGRYVAYNTDWSGAIKALKETADLKNRKVAVIGAGGAARAVVYGLLKEKANVSIFNRSFQNAKNLADQFNLRDVNSITMFDKIKSSDIIINTTSVGMEPNQDKSPIPVEIIQKSQVVFDIVYTPKETALIKGARKRGAKIVYGYKMILYGGTEIFELITEKKAPVEVMERTLLASSI